MTHLDPRPTESLPSSLNSAILGTDTGSSLLIIFGSSEWILDSSTISLTGFVNVDLIGGGRVGADARVGNGEEGIDDGAPFWNAEKRPNTTNYLSEYSDSSKFKFRCFDFNPKIYTKNKYVEIEFRDILRGQKH